MTCAIVTSNTAYSVLCIFSNNVIRQVPRCSRLSDIATSKMQVACSFNACDGNAEYNSYSLQVKCDGEIHLIKRFNVNPIILRRLKEQQMMRNSIAKSYRLGCFELKEFKPHARTKLTTVQWRLLLYTINVHSICTPKRLIRLATFSQ